MEDEIAAYNRARQQRMDKVEPPNREWAWLREVAEEITRLRFEIAAQKKSGPD